MICEACQNIFRGHLQLFEGVEPGSYVSDTEIHHKTIEDWWKATRESCQICVWIWIEVANDDGNIAQDGRTITLEAFSSFTKYRVHERNGMRSVIFLKTSSNVGDVGARHILRVTLAPLKSLLYL